MEVSRKILIIDKSIDRKKRITAVKQRGFAVFPALNLAEARSRCRPGAYDLVVVNGTDEPDAAMNICEQLRERVPSQPVLLMLPQGAEQPDADYVVEDDPAALAEKVEAVFRHLSGTADTSVGRSREDLPARATA